MGVDGLNRCIGNFIPDTLGGWVGGFRNKIPERPKLYKHMNIPEYSYLYFILIVFQISTGSK